MEKNRVICYLKKGVRQGDQGTAVLYLPKVVGVRPMLQKDTKGVESILANLL